jgi:hypothetical protein
MFSGYFVDMPQCVLVFSGMVYGHTVWIRVTSQSHPHALLAGCRPQQTAHSTQHSTMENAASTTTTAAPQEEDKQQAIQISNWTQTLDEVVVVVCVPLNTKASDINCQIRPKAIQIQLVKSTTFGTIDTEESTWTLEEEGLILYLQKANKGVVWESLFIDTDTANLNLTHGTSSNNNKLDAVALEAAKQELLKQRWQEENPGMDFRDAVFNGAAPDPRSYMGGI